MITSYQPSYQPTLLPIHPINIPHHPTNPSYQQVLGKEPKFWAAPIGLFDAIINSLAFFGQWFEGAEDAAELARIGIC